MKKKRTYKTELPKQLQDQWAQSAVHGDYLGGPIGQQPFPWTGATDGQGAPEEVYLNPNMQAAYDRGHRAGVRLNADEVMSDQLAFEAAVDSAYANGFEEGKRQAVAAWSWPEFSLGIILTCGIFNLVEFLART